MKELKLKLITVLLIMVLMLITSVAVFGATGSLTVRWVPDVSNAIEGKEVKVTLSITDFSNVDTSLPLIGSATLQYDTSIFSSIKVEGKNSWAATQGGENTLLLESPMSGTINEGEIATITLTINSNVTTFDTEIKLNSFELTNDDGMEEEEANIDISNMNLTATARVNSGSDNEADNPQNPSDDNNNQGSTETPDAEDPSDDNQNNDQNNNQDEENPNDNNSEADDDQSAGANEIEKVEDLTVAKDSIPQTGTNYIAISIIALVVLIGIIAFIRYKKYVQLMNKGV